MTTTKLPAFVTTGARDVPHAGSRLRGHTAALIHQPDRPGVVWLVGPDYHLRVTVEGLTAGLFEEYVEPFGHVTVGPSFDGSGLRWLVVDVDLPGGGNRQWWLNADRVAAFLGPILTAEVTPSAIFAAKRPGRAA